VLTHEPVVAITPLITLEDLEEALAGKGISLVKGDFTPPLETDLTGIPPHASYTVEDVSGHQIFVYIYDSIPEKIEKYTPDWWGARERFVVKDYVTLDSKNVVLMIDPFPIHPKDWEEEIMDIYLSIRELFVFELNEMEELVFEGEGLHWNARVKVQQYMHWWEEENGRIRSDGAYAHKAFLQYKDSYNPAGGEFAYHLKYPRGSTSGIYPDFVIPFPVDAEDYFEIYLGGGSGILYENEILTLTLTWKARRKL